MRVRLSWARLVLVFGAAALQGTCAFADARSVSTNGNLRRITYHDLIELVELGASPEMDFNGLAVSADGRRVAIETIQAVVSKNVTESRWRFISLDGEYESTDAGPSNGPFVIEDRRPQRPVWLRDSQWIVYLAKFGASTQLWRTRIDGKRREQLTSAPSDVVAFVLSQDGQRLIYATHDPSSTQISDEGTRGYLYDERFAPLLSYQPLDDDPGPRSTWTYDLERRIAHPASAADRDELEAVHPLHQPEVEPARRWHRKAAKASVSVWLEDAKGRSQADPERPLTIVRNSKANGPIRCDHDRCTGYFKGLWISEDGQTVYFLRWVGPYSYGAFGVYALDSDSTVREILRTYDSLEACSLVRAGLLCSHESAITPRDLVLIDLVSGRYKTIFDPNPHFREIRFGEVLPLTWNDGKGVEAYGRLVKPVEYVPGRRYPLAVVQYRSRGFLRGGTGDECPIHVLSSRGFAVLSFHRPEDWEVLADYTSVQDAEKKFWRDLRDRRRVASGLRAGVKLLSDMGIVDPGLVGIHGLSDGANTASYLLIHFPKEFAAASVAGTYWNPMLYYLFGPKLQDRMRWFGLPFPGYEGMPAPWRNLSIAVNAKDILTPILIQAADSELLPETETFTALRRYSRPVEMHVFPSEFHVKVQPAHRLHIYERNVQWFQFWLQNVEDSNPVDPEQYARWRNLRMLQMSSSERERKAIAPSQSLVTN